MGHCSISTRKQIRHGGYSFGAFHNIPLLVQNLDPTRTPTRPHRHETLTILADTVEKIRKAQNSNLLFSFSRMILSIVSFSLGGLARYATLPPSVCDLGIAHVLARLHFLVKNTTDQ